MEDELKKLIRQKLKEANLNTFDKTDDKLLYESITSVINQFLSNYIVIGFDLHGRPFMVAKNDTVKDDYALRTLATKFINQDWQSKK